MSIKSEIARIKEARQNKRSDYAKLFNDVKRLVEFAKEIQNLRTNVAWNTLLHENQEMKNSWDAFERLLNETNFISRVNALMTFNGHDYMESGALKSIKDRIMREYVTISVMGPVSAGKSVFLQALTGLDNNVIPVSSDTCTATRSFFKNSTSKSATVFFHNESEIIKIIMKHIALLNMHLKNNNNKTVTIINDSDVLGMSLASIISKISQYGYLDDSLYNGNTIAIDKETSDCTSIDYYKTLKHYIDNYGVYAPYVAHAPKEFNEGEIMTGQLKAFLAYNENITYANAVEHVEISWPLEAVNGESLGDIHLIDTMGIGEAKLGVSEFLTKTLRDETDIALALCAVKSAASLVQDPNTKMFQKTLKNAIVGRKPEQWIYYLLNKYTSATEADVAKMKSDLEDSLSSGENKIFLNPNTWGTVEFIDSDMNLNRDAVLGYFTNTVLFNLTKSIGEIDEHFISTAKKEIDSLIDQYDKVKLSLKNVKIPSLDKKAVVQEKLGAVKKKLSAKIDTLHAQSGDEIKNALFEYLDNNPFGCHFAYCFEDSGEIQKKIRDIQPSLKKLNPAQRISARVEKIRDIIFPYINNYDTKNQFENGHAFSIMGLYCDKMFNAFVSNFTSVILGTMLVERFQNFKRDVWAAFICEGGLGNVLSGNVIEWPTAWTNKLEESNKYNDLKNALVKFNETKIELKEEILQSIKAKLLECVYCHNDFRYNTVEKNPAGHTDNTGQFNDIQSFCLAVFNLLKNKENEIITGVKSDYDNFVGANVLSKQHNLLKEISNCILGQGGFFPYAQFIGEKYPIYDQLLEFYLDNYVAILGNSDDFSKKVAAIDLYNDIVKNK